MARKVLRHKVWWLVGAAVVLVAYWFLPISGQVLVLNDVGQGVAWPRFDLDGASQPPGSEVTVAVTDVNPWTFVHLLVDGVPADALGTATAHADTWTWRWTYRIPDDAYTLVFYYDCHTGCIERGRMAVGVPSQGDLPAGTPTKLGVVMPNPDRDWHGRSGWVVEVTYARRAGAAYWGVDDLAQRVRGHLQKGLRVLVRVDYDQRQSLPPADDYVALAEYLAYVQRLARDRRLDGVYGYIVGSDYNTLDASVLAPDQMTTPAWYARLFNGYGEAVDHVDNVVQIVHSERPDARVLVGPLRPWSLDADGDIPHALDLPWLNYMNTLVSLLDASARVKSEAGVPLAAPDGFDVQAPGRPDVPEMASTPRAEEPRTALPREAWGGAQAGFRVYTDWLSIINAYPTTQGLPVYIISTNTYDRDGDVPPAQNYPRGWLTTALDVANAEPQVKALVWFLDDFPHTDQWDWFSLTERPGRLVDAAEEFDALLR